MEGTVRFLKTIGRLKKGTVSYTNELRELQTEVDVALGYEHKILEKLRKESELIRMLQQKISNIQHRIQRAKSSLNAQLARNICVDSKKTLLLKEELENLEKMFELVKYFWSADKDRLSSLSREISRAKINKLI